MAAGPSSFKFQLKAANDDWFMTDLKNCGFWSEALAEMKKINCGLLDIFVTKTKEIIVLKSDSDEVTLAVSNGSKIVTRIGLVPAH